jgi:hypothetical protein
MCIPAGTALGYVYGGLVRLLAQLAVLRWFLLLILVGGVT